MEFEDIKLELCDQIATITLNRPERLNAVSTDMVDELYTALHMLEDSRVLVLTGEGRAFCSGANLNSKKSKPIKGGQGAYLDINQHYNPVMLKLAKLNIPTLSAVNGLAAGIGVSMALSSDFVIARDSAYFLMAFVNIGLVPDGGASWMLTRLVGKARATQMMMLGEKIPAATAADWGLIYKCVAAESFDSEVRALAVRLASLPTAALGLMRQNLAQALESDYATSLHREAEGQWIAGDSEDAREGALAFLEKRKAQFTGK